MISEGFFRFKIISFLLVKLSIDTKREHKNTGAKRRAAARRSQSSYFLTSDQIFFRARPSDAVQIVEEN